MWDGTVGKLVRFVEIHLKFGNQLGISFHELRLRYTLLSVCGLLIYLIEKAGYFNIKLLRRLCGCEY